MHIAENEKTLILDNISEAIVHLDTNRKIKWLNKTAAEMMGASQEKLIGRECHAEWCVLDAECEDCPFARTLQSRKATRGIVVDARGSQWRVEANPIFDPNGELIGVVEMRHLD